MRTIQSIPAAKLLTNVGVPPSTLSKRKPGTEYNNDLNNATFAGHHGEKARQIKLLSVLVQQRLEWRHSRKLPHTKDRLSDRPQQERREVHRRNWLLGDQLQSSPVHREEESHQREPTCRERTAHHATEEQLHHTADRQSHQHDDLNGIVCSPVAYFRNTTTSLTTLSCRSSVMSHLLY